jgi:hypothetical protein
MTLPDLLLPTCTQMMGALSSWLGKAAAQRPDDGAEALLTARLAPDMFPLSTQVRFACVQSLEAVARLQGAAFPPTVAVLRGEALDTDHPGTIAAAQARIAETIAALDEAAATLAAIDPATPIAHTLPQGMVFDFTAEQYVRDWAIPQFYFHVMTAYAILRAQGVTLGKADYVTHLFAYLRPGTMPAA